MSARQTAEERCRGERAYPIPTRGEGICGEKAYAGRGHTRGEGIPTPRGEGLLLMKTRHPYRL